jgi:hypothetical protein
VSVRNVDNSYGDNSWRKHQLYHEFRREQVEKAIRGHVYDGGIFDVVEFRERVVQWPDAHNDYLRFIKPYERCVVEVCDVQGYGKPTPHELEVDENFFWLVCQARGKEVIIRHLHRRTGIAPAAFRLDKNCWACYTCDDVEVPKGVLWMAKTFNLGNAQ